MDWLKKNKWWAIIGGAVLFVGIASASPSSTPSTSVQPAAVVLSQQQTLPTAPQAPQAARQAVQGQYNQPSQPIAPTLSNDSYYTNSSGNSVHSPAYTNTGDVPPGATAQCGDGTYSFSQHRSGTCSHHGGVSQWF